MYDVGIHHLYRWKSDNFLLLNCQENLEGLCEREANCDTDATKFAAFGERFSVFKGICAL